jgi:tryptophan-rich sensory protein
MSAETAPGDRPTLRSGRRWPWPDVAALSAWVLVCFAASAVGAIAVGRTLDTWYVALRKPAWNPPNWVFAPVWTSLYTAMAVSAWLVWRRRREQPRESGIALSWFGIQLVLNAAWSWIFFAWRQPGWGFAEVVVLWIAIVVTIARSWRVSRPSAALLLPYLAWVSFASALNGEIWRLNH